MTAPPDDEEARARLDEAVSAVAAPDVVFALSRHGRRTVRSGGTAPPPPVPRDRLRYEIGSATKTFTGLLLACLTTSGALPEHAVAATCLDPGRPAGRHPVTLTHLITHTSGLPGLPADLYPRALPHWYTNPYAHYPAERVVRAFLRHRPRRRPGTRWAYSNFGVAVLGHALAAAAGASWEALLTCHVLRPLGLDGIALRAGGPDTDATGHRSDGTTPTPPLRIGGFQAAGAVGGGPPGRRPARGARRPPPRSARAGGPPPQSRPPPRRGRGPPRPHPPHHKKK
ncbi:serine hydrolase domain-containing protein [Streptomyces sp. NPDC050856]|uniref:serine hydrolase domain-containing protein n=1 Tax=Streptomyces sp. NPDC050856 TaxID=3154939 RepID=UPI0033F2B976